MKIAIVSDRVYPFFKGGGEKRYWDISKILTKKGNEIHFFTGQWPKMKKEMIIEGIHLHGVYKVKNFYINGRKSIKESLIYTLNLFPTLIKADFDVIDCEQMPLFSMFPSKIACLLKRKKLIVTWHEAWGREYWQNYLGKIKGIFGYLVEKTIVKFPDKIVSVSEHTTKGLIKKLKVNKNKIVTIPNAIDFKKIQSIKSSKETSDVIFAGRLLSHKNVDVLIKAITIIKKSKKDIKCIIIGDGPEKSNLQKLTKQLNLNKNIIFKGFIEKHEDVLALIKSSKVFILPSTREGFGISVIEANSCGIPVVTTNHKDNAAKNLIKLGKNGFLTKLGDKQLAKTIIQALKQSKSMKKWCLEEAKQYGWSKIIWKFEGVYK